MTAGDAPEWDLIKFQVSKVQFDRDLVTARPVCAGCATSSLSWPWSAAEALLEVVGELRRAAPCGRLARGTPAGGTRRTSRCAGGAAHGGSGTADADLAYAQRHRDIDVALEYQRIGSDNTVGATVSFPLLLSHKFEGQISQGLAQVQQANVAFDLAKVQAIADVEKAYQAYQASRQVLQVYTTEALAKAEASFRIAGVSYRQGATSLLEVQEAQRTLNQTRRGQSSGL